MGLKIFIFLTFVFGGVQTNLTQLPPPENTDLLCDERHFVYWDDGYGDWYSYGQDDTETGYEISASFNSNVSPILGVGYSLEDLEDDVSVWACDDDIGDSLDYYEIHLAFRDFSSSTGLGCVALFTNWLAEDAHYEIYYLCNGQNGYYFAFGENNEFLTQHAFESNIDILSGEQNIMTLRHDNGQITLGVNGATLYELEFYAPMKSLGMATTRRGADQAAQTDMRVVFDDLKIFNTNPDEDRRPDLISHNDLSPDKVPEMVVSEYIRLLEPIAGVSTRRIAYDGVAGEIVSFTLDLDRTNNDIQLELYAPNGSLVARGVPTSPEIAFESALQFVVLPEDGRYEIAITNLGQEQGTYQLNIDVRDADIPQLELDVELNKTADVLDLPFVFDYPSGNEWSVEPFADAGQALFNFAGLPSNITYNDGDYTANIGVYMPTPGSLGAPGRMLDMVILSSAMWGFDVIYNIESYYVGNTLLSVVETQTQTGIRVRRVDVHLPRGGQASVMVWDQSIDLVNLDIQLAIAASIRPR